MTDLQIQSMIEHHARIIRLCETIQKRTRQIKMASEAIKNINLIPRHRAELEMRLNMKKAMVQHLKNYICYYKTDSK